MVRTPQAVFKNRGRASRWCPAPVFEYGVDNGGGVGTVAGDQGTRLRSSQLLGVNMSAQQPNTVIRASAGTGKTYALTNRILALLLDGEEPERIIALTFNRTAAGEIFDTVIERLATAAQSGPGAAKLASDLCGLRRTAALDVDTCRKTLRKLLLRLHLSPIGTIDSFFVKIISAFPFEFGISGTFSITGENEQKVQRERLLRELLRPAADAGEAGEQQSFFEAFKRATFGREEKRLHDLLAEFVQDYHDLYLNAADLGLWGAEAPVWGAAMPWRQLAPEELALAITGLRDIPVTAKWNEKQQAAWAEFLEFAGAFTPESPYPGAKAPLAFRNLLEALPGDPAADATTRAQFKLYKAVELSEMPSALAFRLVRHVGACVLRACLEKTRGIGELLARFDAAYDVRLRRAGRLTFGDIAFLLSGGHGGTAGTLSADTAADDRMFIEYRLDSTFKHWALDEFQDTSRRQWQVIENLLDEVIQDSTGERSALIVGDVKQAIYGWRGGDSRLMQEIISKYNGDGRGEGNGEVTGEGGQKGREEKSVFKMTGATPAILKVDSLVKTWRCCPDIIALVNTVFARLELTPELVALGVVDDWRKIWETHASARQDAAHVAFRILPKSQDMDPLEARLGPVCERLLEVRPWECGLTAAVLVRGNKAGQAVLECLRRQQIPCALFGEERLADNPLVLACLSLVKVAAHPGDTLAWEHLRMTPFAGALPATPGRFAERFLRELHEGGFEAALRPWVAKILAATILDSKRQMAGGHVGGVDVFTQRRAAQLLAAAQEFDVDGSKDCLEFAAFAREYRIIEPMSSGTVQIMTIHKSKGLGFDLVFLPELQSANGNICSAGIRGLHPDTDDQGETRWVLEMPGQAFAKADAALSEAVRKADRAGCFEELCLLYVALTRAKRELQIVATEPGESAKSVHLATVLTNALSGSTPGAGRAAAPPPGVNPETVFYANGDAEWWRGAVKPGSGDFQVPVAVGADFQVPISGEVEAGGGLETPTPGVASRKRHPRRLPSRAKGEAYPAGNLFAAASAKGREHGTALHELFQELTWAGAESADEIVRRWRAKSTVATGIAESAARAFRRALAQPEIQAELRKPEAQHETSVELWREQSFELILDGEWVSGTMDRVVLRRNAAGVAESAEILDYKSDRVTDAASLAVAAATHTPQMALYRRVLSRLTGLAAEKIRCRLLFTGAGRTVEVS